MICKNLFKILLAVILIVANVSIVNAAPITNMRSSVSPARVRFVLDSEKPVAYKVEQTGKKLVIHLPKSSTKQINMAIKDNIVRSANWYAGRNLVNLQCRLPIQKFYNTLNLIVW